MADMIILLLGTARAGPDDARDGATSVHRDDRHSHLHSRQVHTEARLRLRYRD